MAEIIKVEQNIKTAEGDVILYPKTSADQVVTDPARVFVPANQASKLVGLKSQAELDAIHKTITDQVTTNGNMIKAHSTTLGNLLINKVDKSLLGEANGVATLDENGQVPAAQLPSYVDDVLEFNGRSKFPATGEAGKIYTDTETNLTYRWSGSTYVEISKSLALGENSSTAYPGDKGAQNRAAITSLGVKTTAIETNLAETERKRGLNETAISTLTTRVRTNESAIETLDTDLTTAKTGIVNQGAAIENLMTGKLSAGVARKLETARTIELQGDVSGSVTFDGSANVAIDTVLADRPTLTQGVYSAVAVNKQGLVLVGAQSIELGSVGQETSSSKLMTSGIFFKRV